MGTYDAWAEKSPALLLTSVLGISVSGSSVSREYDLDLELAPRAVNTRELGSRDSESFFPRPNGIFRAECAGGVKL
jgi:hypothetical protein